MSKIDFPLDLGLLQSSNLEIKMREFDCCGE